MLTTLITNIKDALEDVAGLDGKVYPYPVSKPAGYPFAVFFPIAFNNRFLSSAENMIGERFRIFLVYETQQAGLENVWKTFLPNLVDAVRNELAETWNQGTIGGSGRVWWSLETGEWTQEITQQGGTVTASLDLIVNYSTDI
ncbi:MAG: hypothetical protein Q8Q08_12825 [Candidatus Omnitrophota bacterium]|nr:hypothetical protein [Candidatus Omnitrophota bacterium]